jgi:hypothetical protein
MLCCFVAADTRGAGSRRLLHEAWCADFACKLMAHPDWREALPAHAKAIPDDRKRSTLPHRAITSGLPKPG